VTRVKNYQDRCDHALKVHKLQLWGEDSLNGNYPRRTHWGTDFDTKFKPTQRDHAISFRF
jgi:hypothetical protein